MLGGRKLVQQLSLSGNCSELVFQVEFQLSEIKVSCYISFRSCLWIVVFLRSETVHRTLALIFASTFQLILSCVRISNPSSV